MDQKKIVIICDCFVNFQATAPFLSMAQYGAQVAQVDDPTMQTTDTLFTIMKKTEEEGADACEASPQAMEAVKDADILVVHMCPVNRKLLDNAPKLKNVFVLRGGCNNVDLALCKERGIVVTNSNGRSSPAVADYTVGMILSAGRNIAFGHHNIKEGRWVKDYPNKDYCLNLRDQTVGIVGIGSIGGMVAERLRGFGCRILAYDPFFGPEEVAKRGAEPRELDDLLRESDFVTVHLRHSEKTDGFFGAEQFALMKLTAVFINTARPGLVDEEALIAALKDGKIGGAALDVFGTEPLPADSPFLDLDNVVLTPHIAGQSNGTSSFAVEIAVQNVKRLLTGESLINIMNP
ncbi:2-hydroxyacid dehydrogenase [Zongyangia hominis]|uniref:2-hydroxyacid dehydrogenase n=1 Tax=Zongyangia hominis TaxID=2763677 RepID=A0A926IBF6_9FIRM|nr:2-hydroxyacid dehydrogenase [Zongyangia hominis]MBC8571186.1 2-hydroxyacid dehydrogenase [Zongyangia hominis]